ncbi:MAG: efflux RND transporter periplasmic adaptor subunit [Chakrabartia sp.]
MNVETKLAREAETLESDYMDAARARRRKLIMIGLGVVLVIGLIASRFLGGSAPADTGEAGKQAPRVTVIVPGLREVESSVSATGSLAAKREMPVGAVGEGGMVVRVLVDAGDWVKAGQVLAVVDRQVQAQQSQSLGAQIRVAEANARLAQNELDRAKALAERGFISKADIDRKTAQRDAATAQLNVARAQFGENRARIGRLDIRAPSSGLLLARNVEPGQVVGGGSGVLFRIAKEGEMEMRAQLAEADLAKLAVGHVAKVTPVGTTNSYSGRIWQMPPVIDPATRQGMVRIALAYDPGIRPGGFATAALSSGRAKVPLLPESAVQSDEKGNYVFVVGANKKVSRRPVKVGDVSDAGITILGGLNGSEQVVLSAGAFLNDGETVVPVRSQSK